MLTPVHARAFCVSRGTARHNFLLNNGKRSVNAIGVFLLNNECEKRGIFLNKVAIGVKNSGNVRKSHIH